MRSVFEHFLLAFLSSLSTGPKWIISLLSPRFRRFVLLLLVLGTLLLLSRLFSFLACYRCFYSLLASVDLDLELVYLFPPKENKTGVETGVGRGREFSTVTVPLYRP